ncbi:MAG: succinate dehydrogenase, hydrophobic membrane anchor protein [Erythrobacter sp.]|uniref:succinate dehydrogenase, hydrophobic membrane anchor protein n=1 Tax=Erythrobacter sp. TaxID=1042 RepID=UPI0025ED57DA|nr:succinate dehydrogenase, hydrophobic membrane anchor protein [Erythrobacter sp.]MCM0000604.1 succinate dehydrogenase, hydrophobic membrane anchor protein [Erythrobacter sp.]
MPEQDTRAATRRLPPGGGGAEEFIAVRWNSLALLMLYAWLLTALVLLLPDLSHARVTGWLAHPLNTLLMVLLIAESFRHVRYGLDELIDDYLHAPLGRAVAKAANKSACIVGGVFGVLCVLRIAFGAA